ncbi:putative NADPH-dependent 1-acyl dihydroxyacetone phosphate reductase [Immersiella caudata]|uniref:NADPH-dependent 1-acyl dihydroxyacetone phosphate reductase n=1 Tax=Immersiella caudata TaxID=314043 RepID=A0AA39WVH0_9PEZI|nr:putative NADPH-dependent 1-acyl dihydroxyacetone phosphate reductase [Immersiella caudata]
MSPAPTTVLITGGNRGIGLGVVEKFLSRPNYTVIALNRSPSDSLQSTPSAEGSTLIVIKYDASNPESAKNAIRAAQEQGVTHLDIVIANAAVLTGYPLVKDATRDGMLHHYLVNVVAPVELYQAARELLSKSKKPVFSIIGSGSGSLSRHPPIPNAYYGASKAVLPWYALRIHSEEEWLSSLVIDPGWVKTEMGNSGAVQFGLKEAYGEVEDAVNGIYNLTTTATREKFGGKLVQYDGEILTY